MKRSIHSKTPKHHVGVWLSAPLQLSPQIQCFLIAFRVMISLASSETEPIIYKEWKDRSKSRHQADTVWDIWTFPESKYGGAVSSGMMRSSHHSHLHSLIYPLGADYDSRDLRVGRIFKPAWMGPFKGRVNVMRCNPMEREGVSKKT